MLEFFVASSWFRLRFWCQCYYLLSFYVGRVKSVRLMVLALIFYILCLEAV